VEVRLLMKVAFAVNEPGPDATVEYRFGRAPMFTIIDLDSGQHEVIDGPGVGAAGGAGVATAQALAQRGVTAVVAGNLGPNASAVLQASGIECYSAGGMTVSEAAKMLQEGQLQKTSGPTVAGHFGLRPGSQPGQGPGNWPGPGAGGGAGMGRGGGAGMGRGGGAGMGRGGGAGMGRGGGAGMGRGGGRRGGKQP